MGPSHCLAFAALVVGLEACSHFRMSYTNESFQLSGRTMDLGSSFDWIAHSFPKGQKADVLGAKWTSRYGYVGFTPRSAEAGQLRFKFNLDKLNLGILSARDVVSDGLNERGLSCGFLSLENSQFQKYDLLHPQRNVFSMSLCKWALENFASVDEVQEALPKMHFFVNTNLHFVLADAAKKTVVVEFLDAKQYIHEDVNDGKDTFGIMTNEPPFEWQLENVKHMEWKRTLARSSVTVPGNWYPDERFLRIHIIKQAIEKTKQPKTYRQAVANTVAIINSVTVPMGDIPGTDSEASGGEGLGDHTQWGVIRDHLNVAYYLRSETNPSYRRIKLSDLNLEEGAQVGTMEIEQDPWYIDVSSSFSPSTVV